MGKISFRQITMKLMYLAIALEIINEAYGDCIWYGQCAGSGYKIKNCPYFGKAKPFREQDKEVALNILSERCPHFLKKYQRENFCCDLDMLKSMNRGMSMAKGMFGRCPTCVHNLFQHICEFTCSPNQNSFMEPVTVLTNPKNGKKYISEINLFATAKYTNMTFLSCRDVVMPSTGENALTLACNNNKYCTAEEWFRIMGDNKQPFVPFQINYISATSDMFTPLEPMTFNCSESFEGSMPCSCTDCEASCNIPFRDPTVNERCITEADFFTYFVFVLMVILILSTAVFLCWNWKNGNSDRYNFLEAFGDKIHSRLEAFFTAWGYKCAAHPLSVIAISIAILEALLYGGLFLKVTTQPDEIWASPTSRSRIEKDYFESKFSPFYRTNQVFLKCSNSSYFQWKNPTTNSLEWLGPIFQKDFLSAVHDLQMKIQQIRTEDGHGLETMCLAPMRNDFFKNYTVEQCTIQSVWGYFQNDKNILNKTDEYISKLISCLSNNYDASCFAPYGGPIFSPLAVIGFKEEESEKDGVKYAKPNYLLSTGLSLTFLIENHLNKTKLAPALAWEEKFIKFMKNWAENDKPDTIEVAFSAERSIQDEIERESGAELGTVIISYAIMFVYVTVALGKFRSFSTFLVGSRIILGAGGIVIVIASVLASIGFFGYLGVPTTLLTIEVIPFLVLAVGVDNIFILVLSIERMSKEKEETVEELIGRALGRMGPSLLLTSFSEASCFAIGALSNMPAVKTFALYSSVAIVFDFFLQITAFISWLSIDLRRLKGKRLDIFFCVKMSKERGEEEQNSNFLHNIFRNYYGPFLMKPSIRTFVIALFSCWFVASIYFTIQLELGLDQELSMPEDSYLVDYFKDLRNLFSMGPPVYFVVKRGLDYTNENETNTICGTIGCDGDSLVTYLTRASKLTNLTYIAKAPSSWIDDYFTYINPDVDCCKMFPNRSYCSPEMHNGCMDCSVKLVNDLRPGPRDFMHFLPFFLTDNPSDRCPKAGRASYSRAIHFEKVNGTEMEIGDTYFMAYHTPLQTSKDYYTALERARRIADHLSSALTRKLNKSMEVFPYSVFYVFYEQYLTIVNDAMVSLSLSLMTIFVVTFVLTGLDYVSSLLVLCTVCSIIIDLMGLMYLWGITLNAISLVNLIVSVGIGVEFCSHLVHSFAISIEGDRVSRALHSIGIIGNSIFSGITLTKFSGIIVLAFARSLIFRVFYFRMYLGMVLIGVAHGLVLMPILLSYFGPRVNRYRVSRLGFASDTKS